MQPEQGNDQNPSYPFLNPNINNNTKLKWNITEKSKPIDAIKGKDKTFSSLF